MQVLTWMPALKQFHSVAGQGHLSSFWQGRPLRPRQATHNQNDGSLKIQMQSTAHERSHYNYKGRTKGSREQYSN